MRKSENESVQNFFDGIMHMDSEQYNSLIEIREIVFTAYPETKEKIMYGGIVFFLNSDMFSGVFVNKNHITLEFSKGYLMKDTNALLEGSGKFRRHLKIKAYADIKNKDVAFFVRQAI